jgi:hypothetical protein
MANIREVACSGAFLASLPPPIPIGTSIQAADPRAHARLHEHCLSADELLIALSFSGGFRRPLGPGIPCQLPICTSIQAADPEVHTHDSIHSTSQLSKPLLVSLTGRVQGLTARGPALTSAPTVQVRHPHVPWQCDTPHTIQSVDRTPQPFS